MSVVGSAVAPTPPVGHDQPIANDRYRVVHRNASGPLS